MKAMPKRPDIEANRCLSRAIMVRGRLVFRPQMQSNEDAQRHYFIQHRGAGLPPLIDQMKQPVRRRLADEVADVFVQVSLNGLFSHECC
jgi:hypothetical protein